ncbi:MAG: CARDB domain-containing protein [Chthoniobacterales bacterium]
MKIQFTLFLAVVASLVAPLPARAIMPAMPDLVIEKITQTSSTFWMVKVRNIGQRDSAATTLKMIATPGGSYSCPVAAIKAGGTADVPCRMPFKSRTGMQCEFILNPDKSIAENNYGNNRTSSQTNPKFN